MRLSIVFLFVTIETVGLNLVTVKTWLKSVTASFGVGVSRCTKIDVRCTYRNDLIINILQNIVAAFMHYSLMLFSKF
jgi:hypothetical protein